MLSTTSFHQSEDLALEDVPQTVAEQRLPLHHGVGPELLLVADLVLLRGLGEAPQPADHLLLVFHVHRNIKLELGQLFTISSDNIFPGESKVVEKYEFLI